MSSREKILASVKKNQPVAVALPALVPFPVDYNPVDKFSTTLVNIGGAIITVNSYQEVGSYVQKTFPSEYVIINTIKELTDVFDNAPIQADPHLLANVNLAIVEGHFGVAENAAIWITDDLMGDRALPFISEHLAIVIRKSTIVPTLHEAYEKIGSANYNFGGFIAGPSKTADIEQALVLGAHGAKSLTVFVLDN